MNIDELLSEKRIGLSFYKVEGLEWSKDYDKIMRLLEKETKKKPKTKDFEKGIREFKANDYKKEFDEMRMEAIVDIARPIIERVVENDEIVIKDSVYYEPRPIFSVFKYESSIMIIYAKETRDANRFISYFLDIIGGGVYFKRLIFGERVMEYFLSNIEELNRVRIGLTDNEYIDDILLKGLGIQFSPEYQQFKYNQKGEIIEMGVKIVLDGEKLVRMHIRRDGRLSIYKGKTEIDQPTIERLIAVIEKRYVLEEVKNR